MITAGPVVITAALIGLTGSALLITTKKVSETFLILAAGIVGLLLDGRAH